MSTRAAQRYAKALLDLAKEKKSEEAIFQDMLMLHDTFKESEDLRSLVASPAYHPEKKKEILLSIFGKQIQDLTSKLFSLLTHNNRIELLYEVTKSFIRLYNKDKGIVQATVTTSIPLNDKMKKDILEKARKISGAKEVSLHNKIDPSIIGGYILRVGDVQIDAGIAGKLELLKRELTK